MMPDQFHAVVWYAETGQLSNFMQGWKQLRGWTSIVMRCADRFTHTTALTVAICELREHSAQLLDDVRVSLGKVLYGVETSGVIIQLEISILPILPGSDQTVRGCSDGYGFVPVADGAAADCGRRFIE